MGARRGMMGGRLEQPAGRGTHVGRKYEHVSLGKRVEEEVGGVSS